MTKEKLRRLIDLRGEYESDLNDWNEQELAEFEALLAEFEAWEPDRERDEASRVAAGWGVMKIDLHHAQGVVRAAERYCQCLTEFGDEGQAYCGEARGALEAAIGKFREIEQVGQRPPRKDG